jgi:DNA-binding transcriptional MerR regulator
VSAERDRRETEPQPAAEARAAKSAAAFRTISEVAAEVEVPAHVLRFWEGKFPQLSPLKRGGGRRYYRPADVALLKGMRALLYDRGLTIKGLQKLLREKGPRHVAAIGEGREDAAEAMSPAAPAAPAPRPAADPERLRAVIHRLERLRDRLRA